MWKVEGGRGKIGRGGSGEEREDEISAGALMRRVSGCASPLSRRCCTRTERAGNEREKRKQLREEKRSCGMRLQGEWNRRNENTTTDEEKRERVGTATAEQGTTKEGDERKKRRGAVKVAVRGRCDKRRLDMLCREERKSGCWKSGVARQKFGGDGGGGGWVVRRVGGDVTGQVATVVVWRGAVDKVRVSLTVYLEGGRVEREEEG
jgi:hypothetical protein